MSNSSLYEKIVFMFDRLDWAVWAMNNTASYACPEPYLDQANEAYVSIKFMLMRKGKHHLVSHYANEIQKVLFKYYAWQVGT